MLHKWTRRGLMVGLLAVAMTAVGCKSTSYQKFDLTVSLDDAYAQDSGGAETTVDVVALSGQRGLSMDAVSMREYWTENDPFRQQMIREEILWSIKLAPGMTSATLPSRDKLWNSPVWKTGAKLYILADIPGVGPGRDGRDPRRLSLPRDSELWDAKRLDVLISGRGMTYTPQEKVSGQ